MKKIGHLLWLIVTLYSFLLVSIDQSSASNHELKEELRFIHQEISLLRDENHNQNMEIALLKEKIGITKDSDDQRMATASLGDNNRNKRPVRLLPPHILHGGPKNETELQKQMNRRRYEQPTNCSDLSAIGYTLNGFYQVKSNESANSTDIKLETVFCAFKHAQGTFNTSIVEKRIISRRETNKPGSKMIFYATRSTDLEFMGFLASTITSFDKIVVNSENSFDEKTGTFTVPISGVYLLIFRGNVTFPQENLGRQIWIYYTQNGTNIGRNIILDSNKLIKIEFDKMVKGNRGDMFSVGAYFYEYGAKFSGNSLSFAAYQLKE